MLQGMLLLVIVDKRERSEHLLLIRKARLCSDFLYFSFFLFFDQSNLSLAVEMYFQWTHFDSGSCLRGLPVLQLSAQFISWTNCCLSPAA